MHTVNADQAEFGVRLRRARQQRNLTQSDLSSMLGVSQGTVSRIESGKIRDISVSSEISAFIAQAEKPAGDLIAELIHTIARSDELEALVARILAEI